MGLSEDFECSGFPESPRATEGAYFPLFENTSFPLFEDYSDASMWQVLYKTMVSLSSIYSQTMVSLSLPEHETRM